MHTDASLLADSSAESTYRNVNGVRLHVVAAGAADDPLVVLLHGFPDFFYCWREQIEPLVEAGYRVLVPDQRGYNLSEKPDGVRAYRKSQLVRDVVELVQSEGRDSARVVGHDWGASVAWELALRYPSTVDRLGIVNVPHPRVFRRTLRSNPRQFLRSWYMVFFQIPRFPEWLLGCGDYEPLARTLQRSSRPGTFPDDALERYRDAWRQEGAVESMLNWYRALLRHDDEMADDRVEPSTLVIWGENDEALIPEMAAESVEYCADGRLERFPEATHWVHHEYPDEVAELLVDHLDG